MDYLVSVDPGRVSGWAVLQLNGNHPPTLLDSGQFNPDRMAKWIAWWDKWDDLDGEVALICEGQFITSLPARLAWIGNDSAKISAVYAKQHHSLLIAASAGRWEGCALWAGWTILPRIHPQRWRKAMYGSYKLSSADAKQQARLWCKELVNLELKPSEHHRAEAVVIGFYAAKDFQIGESHE